ncbi:MAG: MetQ/NlpA family ABC transporter substrate-binding protein [Niameybacter sp.]
MKIKKLAFLTVGFLTLTSLLTGCGNTSTSNPNTTTIKLGVNDNDYRIWDYVKGELAKENITLEVISFADYVQPNIALSEGEIDINAFQTNIYFDQFKTDHNLDLTSIGTTVFAPMGIYSQFLESPTDIAESGKVAIPNDMTNGGRALLLLEEAGLIEVDDAAGLIPTLKDVTANPKNLSILELTANQIPRSLPDLDLAVINNGVAVDAKLSPINDSIYIESTDTENAVNYYNIFAVKSSDKDSAPLNRLVEIYQTDAVKVLIDEVYGGSRLPIF